MCQLSPSGFPLLSAFPTNFPRMLTLILAYFLLSFQEMPKFQVDSWELVDTGNLWDPSHPNGGENNRES